jgi:membrane peptidoglycan carboxypeptidase
VPSSGRELTAKAKKLTNVGSLLLCGLLAGLVVAAGAFPLTAVVGLVTKAGAETFDALPSELQTSTAPQATEVYASDNKTLISRFFDENRRDVKIADMSMNMRNAIIAAEDHKFYTHNGVDGKGILRALVANKSGQAQQGASTLTMQFVRMSITYAATDNSVVAAAGEDTTSRKVREARLAVQVEKQLSKDEILERYLNIAPFGHGTYGVYAASQFYFGKAPKDLTVPEAAMIAGQVKSPSWYDPLTTEGHVRTVPVFSTSGFTADTSSSTGTV